MANLQYLFICYKPWRISEGSVFQRVWRGYLFFLELNIYLFILFFPKKYMIVHLVQIKKMQQLIEKRCSNTHTIHSTQVKSNALILLLQLFLTCWKDSLMWWHVFSFTSYFCVNKLWHELDTCGSSCLFRIFPVTHWVALFVWHLTSEGSDCKRCGISTWRYKHHGSPHFYIICVTSCSSCSSIVSRGLIKTL